MHLYRIGALMLKSIRMFWRMTFSAYSMQISLSLPPTLLPKLWQRVEAENETEKRCEDIKKKI